MSERELSQSPDPRCSNVSACLNHRFFKALCDPNRGAILAQLAECCGPRTVSDIAKRHPIDVSVVSRHLAILRDAGILEAEKQGKEVRYSVRFHDLAVTLRTMAGEIEACCGDPKAEGGETTVTSGKRAGSLTEKETELFAIGASVASGCKPCTNYHVRKGREAGASDEEIGRAVRIAKGVRDKAGARMENHGLNLIGAGREADRRADAQAASRTEAMVALAAAFAVNCTTSVEEHIGAARSAGVTDEEIDSILRMAGLVRGKAVSHVERIAERVRKGVAPGESTAE